jgi:hypothetical protein
MSFEKFVADHAVAISLAFLATIFLVAAFLLVAPARSQSIEVGPGGIIATGAGHARSFASPVNTSLNVVKRAWETAVATAKHANIDRR